MIMSDHGMTYGSDPLRQRHPQSYSSVPPSPAKHVKKLALGTALDRVQDKVARVVGSGAYAMVWPSKRPSELRNRQDIVNELRRRLRGCEVYTREEIPEHLHWVVSIVL